MKIRLKVDVSGSRDGKPWPPRGSVTDLPREEAMQLCSNGMAVPVDSGNEGTEAAVPSAADVETRGPALTTESASAVTPGAPEGEKKAPTPTPRRGPGRPRKTAEAVPDKK